MQKPLFASMARSFNPNCFAREQAFFWSFMLTTSFSIWPSLTAGKGHRYPPGAVGGTLMFMAHDLTLPAVQALVAQASRKRWS